MIKTIKSNSKSKYKCSWSVVCQICVIFGLENLTEHKYEFDKFEGKMLKKQKNDDSNFLYFFVVVVVKSSINNLPYPYNEYWNLIKYNNNNKNLEYIRLKF